MAGGADINPVYYGDIPKSYIGTVEEERDNFELNLAKQALERYSYFRNLPRITGIKCCSWWLSLSRLRARDGTRIFPCSGAVP